MREKPAVVTRCAVFVFSAAFVLSCLTLFNVGNLIAEDNPESLPLINDDYDVEVIGLEDEQVLDQVQEDAPDVIDEQDIERELLQILNEEESVDEPVDEPVEAGPEEQSLKQQQQAPVDGQTDQLEPQKDQAKQPAKQEEAANLPVTKVSLDFKDADILNVLRILSYKSGVNIVASPEVSGTVTIRLSDVPWNKALDVILQTYGYGYEKTENIITVYPMEMLTARKREAAALAEVQPTITRVVRLRYVDATDMKNALDSQLSPRGRITVLEMTGQAGWEFGGADLGKRARVSEKQNRSKMLVISDVPTVLEKLEEVIAKLDIVPEQVLIETRILEVNRDKLRDLGLEFGTGSDGDSFVNTSSKGNGDAETQLRLRGQTLTETPATFDPKAALGGALASFDSGLTAYFRKVTGTQFQAILHALEEDVQTNTLSAPRILTLSNQEATILIGTKYPILTSEVSSESAQTVTTTLDYYQDIGIQLNVVPQVNDNGYINLIVHPAVTSTSSNVGDNEYPIIQTRETETQVLIKDGETIVIGGLLKDVKSESIVKTPFLGDIPLLGLLFRRKTVDTEKVDLLIFISARVVKPEEDFITLRQNIDSPVRVINPETK